jgi:hypothetical protein
VRTRCCYAVKEVLRLTAETRKLYANGVFSLEILITSRLIKEYWLYPGMPPSGGRPSRSAPAFVLPDIYEPLSSSTVTRWSDC